MIASATRAYLGLFGKTPPKEIVTKLESAILTRNALFLRAVLDELRQCGKHRELNVKAESYLAAKDLAELYERIIDRWQGDFDGSTEQPELVRRALSLVACARGGLS